MSLSDKFKKLLNIDNDYAEDADEEEVDYSIEPAKDSRAAQNHYIPVNRERKTDSFQSGGSPAKVVDIHTTAKLQVVLKKPEHFDEVRSIADELLDKRTVVLNLEATEQGEAGRMLGFLSGVAYSNAGSLKKIANNTYIITPYNVDVMGDLLDELENNGMFFI